MPPSGDSARSLVLAAVVIQGIVAALVLTGALSLLAAVSAVASSIPTFPTFYGGLIFLFLLVDGLLLVVLTWVGFEFSYRRTVRGDYQGARAPTLVVGILGIPFGYLVVGILYLVAYGKLGDALSELRGFYPGYPMAPGWSYPAYGPPGYPVAGYPGSVPPPAGAPLAGPQVAVAPAPIYAAPMPAAPACPRCGRPATFIQPYNRYFCYTDQIYL